MNGIVVQYSQVKELTRKEALEMALNLVLAALAALLVVVGVVSRLAK